MHRDTERSVVSAQLSAVRRQASEGRRRCFGGIATHGDTFIKGVSPAFRYEARWKFRGTVESERADAVMTLTGCWRAAQSGQRLHRPHNGQ